MAEFYEVNITGHKPWKKVLCIILSIIIAFGTFVTITFGNSKFQKWLGVRSMLSAYAAEIVDTKGAIAVDEDAMIADDHTICLENRDGSNTVYLFSEPISYTDENGDIKTKDISVEKADNELKSKGYDYTNGQNDYRINFSKDQRKGIEAIFEDCSYSIIPLSTTTAEGTESVAEFLNENFEVFQYKNIYGNGTNLRFYPQLNGVKDEIILNQNINMNSFSFELKTKNCTAQLNENGTISLINSDGSTIQTFAAPFAYDNEYVEGDLNSHYTECEYSLVEKNETSYIITITVPNEWLINKNTKYPVFIDPTTSHISNYRDSGIYSKSTSASVCYGKEALCCFGRSSDYGYGRALNHFTMPSDIKKGAKINSAYTWQRETTGRTTSTKVTPHMVTSSWTEGTVTWNTKPSYNSTTGTTRTISSKSTDNSDNPYWYKFNIANMVKQWVDGNKTNYGFCFVSSEETDKNYNWRAFTSKQYTTSSMRPYTVINYTNDEIAPTITSVTGNPTSWTKNNVTLTIKATDNSGGVGLHSTAYSFSTTKGSYSWQATNTKSFSSNQTVYIYVRDAYGNISTVNTVSITKIDKTTPTYTSVTGNPTSWTKNNVTLTVNGAADTKSGLNSTAYSFSTTSSTYKWQSSNKYTVTSNGTYYIYIRDKVGNVKKVTTQTVSKIDKTAPTYTGVTLTDSNPKGDYIDATVIGAKDSLSGLHSTAYSFDGGTNWQASPTKKCYTAQTLDIRIKDAAGNIKIVGQKIVPEPLANVPSINSVNAVYNADTDKTVITVDATDVETNKENLIYSYNGIVSGAQVELDGKVNSVEIVVVDEHNNACNRICEFNYVEEYCDNNFVYLYSPNNENENDNIEYKIGENGEWQSYVMPIALPLQDTSVIYTKYKNQNVLTKKVVSPNLSDFGNYIESFNDFTLSYNNISFDFTRSYNSNDKKWFYSTDSSVTSENEYVFNAVLPDSTELTFIKTREGVYENEINGYILTEMDNGYAVQIDDINYYYDTEGKLSSVGNKYGDTITITRSDSSIVISDDANRTYTLALDSNGNIITITDPAENVITYTYDDNNNLTNVVDQAGVTIGQYSYTNGVLTKNMDKTINYDADGRVASYVYDSGAYTNYLYDDENKTVSTESSVETTTSETYNDALLTVSSTDEDGNTTEYEYDEYYRTLTETSGGTTITYTYDDNGNLLSEVSDDEEAENTYYVYDENGNVIRQQTGTAYTYYVYDENDELTLSATLKEGYTGETPDVYNSDLTCFDTIEYTYNTDGTLQQTVDSKKNETISYTYDSYGNTVKTTTLTENDGESTVGVVDCTYDIMGNLLTSVSGDETSSYTYDNAGRTLLANEKGDCTRTIHDNLGRVIQEIGPEDYDSTKDGLPEENTYSDSNAGHTYVYAANGTLTREKNRIGQTTTYYYNDRGSKIREEFDIYKFYYLNHGELYQVKVAGVTTVSYSYSTDGKFLLLQENYANDDTIRYTYNDNGDVTAQYKNDNSRPYVTYTYNDDGDLTEKVNTDTDLKYVYDGDNVSVYKTSDNSLVQSYTSTETEANEETGAETYTTVTENHFGTTYTSVVRDKSVSYTAGTNTAEYSYQTTGTDEDEKLSADSVKYNDNVILSSAYTYDDNGNVLSKSYGESNVFTNTYDDKDRITSTSYAGKTYNYTYDNDSQLTNVSGNDYNANYIYDNRGNITSKTVNDETTSFTYANSGWKDLLVSVNGTELTYDANGNVLTYGDREYTWNTGRNLASITDGTNTYSYTYDEDGIRTSKTVNGVTTYYNSRNGVIISQSDGTNTMYFQYDTNGTPLGFVLNGVQYFYITNQMNDIIAISDITGTIVGNYEYDAWGKVLIADTQIAQQNPLRYRGYYYDNETGYYYLQSRYYDSEICRFINADIPEISQMSKGLTNGVNIFAYCNNNPINNSDPTGTIALSLVLRIALGALIGAACYFLSWLFFKRFTKEKFSVWQLLINIAVGAVSGLASYFNINKILSFGIDFALTFVSSVSRGCNLLEVLVVSLIVSIVSSLISFGTNKLFSHFKKFGVSSKKIAKYDNQVSSAWKKSIKNNNYKIIKDMIHTYFKRMKTTLTKYITINTFSGLFGQAFDSIRKIAKNRRLAC